MEKEFKKEDFYLPLEGMAEDRRKLALAKFDEHLGEQKSHFLGYQANQELQYDEMAKYLDCQINNLGDPYRDGNFTLNSKTIERAVLDYYARLWNIALYNPDDPGSCWGYVLSMGSSEANLYGL